MSERKHNFTDPSLTRIKTSFQFYLPAGTRSSTESSHHKLTCSGFCWASPGFVCNQRRGQRAKLRNDDVSFLFWGTLLSDLALLVWPAPLLLELLPFTFYMRSGLKSFVQRKRKNEKRKSVYCKQTERFSTRWSLFLSQKHKRVVSLEINEALLWKWKILQGFFFLFSISEAQGDIATEDREFSQSWALQSKYRSKKVSDRHKCRVKDRQHNEERGSGRGKERVLTQWDPRGLIQTWLSGQRNSISVWMEAET